MKIAFRHILLSILGIFVFEAFYGQSQLGTARIQGTLKSFGTTVELEDFSELQLIVSKSHNAVIELNADSSFNIEIPLKKAGYYRLGRNKLYLSPGDHLKVVIDKGNPTIASFAGKGSEANLYLRFVPFPKGGSYLEAGRNLKEKPEETLQFLMQEAGRMQASLNKVNAVSKEFKVLESARIRADLIKSIDGVSGYAMAKFGKKGKPILKNTLTHLCHWLNR